MFYMSEFLHKQQHKYLWVTICLNSVNKGNTTESCEQVSGGCGEYTATTSQAKQVRPVCQIKAKQSLACADEYAYRAEVIVEDNLTK